jgi:hypothetical protein
MKTKRNKKEMKKVKKFILKNLFSLLAIRCDMAFSQFLSALQLQNAPLAVELLPATLPELAVREFYLFIKMTLNYKILIIKG